MSLVRKLLLLLFATSAFAQTFPFVQTGCIQGATAGDYPLTFGSTVTTGNTIHVQVMGGRNGDPSSIKLSNGTTLTADKLEYDGGFTVTVATYHVTNSPAGITGLTVHWGYTGDTVTVCAEEVPAGMVPASNVFDGYSTVTSATVGGSWTAGSGVTTTNAYDIIYGVGEVSINNGVGTPLTLSAGWNTIGVTNAGNNAIIGYKLVSSTGTYTLSGAGGPLGGYTGYFADLAYKYIPPAYTVAGPSSGYVLNASTNFTITNVSISSYPVTITISDGGMGGTVNAAAIGSGTAPYGIVISSSFSTQTFTYTPPSGSVGPITLTWHISSGGDPAPNTSTYTALAWTLTQSGAGCTAANLHAASGACTVTLGCGGGSCTFDGAHGVVLGDQSQLGSFTSGASGNPLTVTPGSGTTSFTYTYTPTLVGNKLISLTPASSNLATQSYNLVSTSTDASTFTCGSGLACATNSASNWTCVGCASHTIPDSGDQVVATGGHITVPAGTVAKVGTCPANNTNADVLLQISGANSGVLEVSATASLRLCGNIKYNAPTNSNPVAWPTLQLDTSSTMYLDANQSATVAYRGYPANANGYNRFLVGASVDTCNFATGVCPTNIVPTNLAPTGAANPILIDPNGISDAFSHQIYGLGISNCGSATAGCITYNSANNTNSWANAGLLDVEGSIFNQTGTIQPAGSYGFTAVSSLIVANDRFLNDLAGFLTLTGPGTVTWTKTCSITGSYFSGLAGDGATGLAWSNVNIIGNVFAGDIRLVWPGTGTTYGAFADNVANWNSTQPDPTFPAPIYNRNIIINTAPVASSHMLQSPARSQTRQDNVYFTIGSGMEAHCGSGTINAPTNGLISLGELSLPDTGHSYTSCEIFGYDPPVPYPVNGPIGSIDHNGAYGTATYTWFGILGHPTSTMSGYTVTISGTAVTATAGPAFPGPSDTEWFNADCTINGVTDCQIATVTDGTHLTLVTAPGNASGVSFSVLPFNFNANQVINTFRGNLGWAPSAGTQNFLMGYPPGPGTYVPFKQVPSNTINFAQVGYNAAYNGTASNSFTTGANSGCSPSITNGTAYMTCQGSGSAPAHDLTGVNPKVLDITRNPLTWAARLHGQPATTAGIWAALAACQSEIWCIEEMRNWVRVGFQPTNLAYRGVAHDGRIVGFSGTLGSGYSGTCGITVTPQAINATSGMLIDLGMGFAGTCTFVGGVPKITITNPGQYYYIASPATVAITCGACTPTVAASLTPIISPHDIGPVPMNFLAGVQ